MRLELKNARQYCCVPLWGIGYLEFYLALDARPAAALQMDLQKEKATLKHNIHVEGLLSYCQRPQATRNQPPTEPKPRGTTRDHKPSGPRGTSGHKKSATNRTKATPHHGGTNGQRDHGGPRGTINWPPTKPIPDQHRQDPFKLRLFGKIHKNDVICS